MGLKTFCTLQQVGAVIVRQLWRRPDCPAEAWVLAFERDWARVLEDSRHSFSLTPLHDTVRSWQLRVAAAAPAVDAYLDSGRDETGFVDPDGVLGARP
ncbi:DUF6247 family protein [Streptomyces sp. NBC_01465]|uniref:DUF6247 family protein n=1 Tax=Streptomyces sp. NBC_01465 TaxID=2903878 RepID=UPI002E30B85E|nr:DUF6247 family protein [Streptomyces sp. NBC_01465]